MPIEFACEECGSVLRVPDGSSGKRSRCPACRHEQEIPFVVQSADAIVPSGKLSIPCPKCQHHLVCDPELLGTRGQCKKCAHIFTISEEPVATAEATPSWVFHCPECRQLFEGREDMRGRKGKCHVCQAVFMIQLEPADPRPAQPNQSSPGSASSVSSAPTPERPASPSTASIPASSNRIAVAPAPATASPPPRPATSEPLQRVPQPAPRKPDLPDNVNDDLTVIDDGAEEERVSKRSSRLATAAQAKVASSEPIRFECSHCRGVMEVPGSTAGLETECPYCQVVLKIPDRGSVPRLASPVASTPAVEPSPLDLSHPLVGNQIDFGNANNPYASTTGAWVAPTSSTVRRSSELTIGNVLQQGFEGLFPSCLVAIPLAIIWIGFNMLFGVAAGVTMAMLRPTPEMALTYNLIFAGVGVMLGMPLAAWVFGAISRTALSAVRRRPFHLGDALNPGGAFGAAILQSLISIVLGSLIYLPRLINWITNGSLRGPEFLTAVLAWLIVVAVVTFLYGIGSCLTLFAGADGHEPSEALQMSFSLVLGNFGRLIAVSFLAGLMAIFLAIPTLGLAFVIPVYMLASLYNLASR